MSGDVRASAVRDIYFVRSLFRKVVSIFRKPDKPRNAIMRIVGTGEPCGYDATVTRHASPRCSTHSISTARNFSISRALLRR